MNSYALLQKKMMGYARVHGIPLSAGFELTNRCNLACRMCFICQNTRETIERELTAQQWIELGRQARDAGMLNLLLSGGEALIRDDFWEIYEGLSRLGLILTLNSNGVLMTEENVRRFAKRPPAKISISIYGSSPEDYERVTGNAAAFEKICKGLDRLKNAGLHFSLRSVLIRDTLPDIENIANFILNHVDRVGIVSYVAPCREEFGKNPLSARLNAKELADANKRLHDAVREIVADQKKKKGEDSGNSGEQAKEPVIKVEDDELIPKESNPEMDALFKDSAFRCLAARTSFWVSWEGHMTPCALAHDPYTLPLETGFLSAWTELRKVTHEIAPCQDCVACKYRESCNTCPVRLRVETGSYQEKAEYLCQMAQQNFEARQMSKDSNKGKGDK